MAGKHPWTQYYMTMKAYYELFKDLIVEHSQQNVRLHIEFENYAQFKCSQCAACCRRDWYIHVNKAYYEKWAPYFDKPESKYPDPFLIFDKGDDERYAFVKKKEGTNECVFLDEDNLCHMQKTHGFENMPKVCQVFPRRQIKTAQNHSMHFLMPTCQKVPLNFYPQRHLQLQVSSDNTPSKRGLPSLKITEQQTMEYWTHFLFKGLCMDLVTDEKKTPIQSLRTLNVLLSQLHQNTSSVLQVQDIQALHQHTQTGLQVSAAGPLLKTTALQWFLRLLPKNINLSRLPTLRELSVLSEFEKRTINAFSRNYLLHSFLVLEDWKQGKLSLYQEILRLVIYNLSFQILAWFMGKERGGITSEILGESLNHIESYMTLDWLDKANLANLPPETCLKRLMVFLSLDLGESL